MSPRDRFRVGRRYLVDSREGLPDVILTVVNVTWMGNVVFDDGQYMTSPVVVPIERAQMLVEDGWWLVENEDAPGRWWRRGDEGVWEITKDETA